MTASKRLQVPSLQMEMGMAARSTQPAPKPCDLLTAAYLRSAHAQSIGTAIEKLGIAIILQSLGS